MLLIVYGWNTPLEIYNTAPPGTPIAAASSYSNTSNGFDTWIELLYLSNRGIEVNTWSGSRGWLPGTNHPSSMSNSTANARSYSALAVTAIGKAFAVVTEGQNNMIDSWQVADDTLDWTSTGTVDIGSAWR